MHPTDTTDLAYGIPLIVIVPAIVEVAKHNGLPSRLDRSTAIIAAMVLLAPGDIALGGAGNSLPLTSTASRPLDQVLCCQPATRPMSTAPGVPDDRCNQPSR